MVGDCSGGYYTDGTCIGTERAVHWTAAKAAAAVRSYNDAPMVRGRMTDVRCTIVARRPAHEAAALCRGAFVAPGKATRRVVARFALGGTGSLNPDCSERWATSPYCAGKGRMVTTGDG
jgi:hypothetical protein